MSEGNRARWVWPLGIGFAVVALVIVALVREPIQLDPSTPEGTVQEYLQAISDEDYNKAFELLDPDGFEGCSTSDLARSAPRDSFTATMGFSGNGGGFAPFGQQFDKRFESIGPARPSEDLVTVDVTLRFDTGGVFGGSWDQYETFLLISEDGSWWITDDPNPWPYFTWDCQRGDF